MKPEGATDIIVSLSRKSAEVVPEPVSRGDRDSASATARVQVEVAVFILFFRGVSGVIASDTQTLCVQARIARIILRECENSFGALGLTGLAGK